MKKSFGGRNPVLPPEICVPDGEAHVFGKQLFVYGSQDKYDDTYCSEEYSVVCTSNMLEWSVHKKSFESDILPIRSPDEPFYSAVDMDVRNPTPFFRNMLKGMGIVPEQIPESMLNQPVDFGAFVPRKNLLFAPDCAYKNGKYYLYYCTSAYSEGVALSDNPTGPFSNPVRLPCGGIDPAVFTDDDGQSYYFWGQFRASAVPLNSDMQSFDQDRIVKNIVTEEEHGFHEGSSVRKRNGIYYYVYPCIYRNNKPTCLAYATSNSPLGPYTYRGIIVDNAKCDPQSWNIHGSIEEFNGQWYVFYHRSSKNSNYNRRLCVEKIYFNADGSIDEVKMTSNGAGEPFALGEKIEGWRACEVYGGAYIDGTDIIFPQGGEAIIRYVKFDSKPQRVVFDKTGDGKLSVYIDEKPLEQADIGVYEVKIICHGHSQIRSITIL